MITKRIILTVSTVFVRDVERLSWINLRTMMDGGWMEENPDVRILGLFNKSK